MQHKGAPIFQIKQPLFWKKRQISASLAKTGQAVKADSLMACEPWFEGPGENPEGYQALELDKYAELKGREEDAKILGWNTLGHPGCGSYTDFEIVLLFLSHFSKKQAISMSGFVCRNRLVFLKKRTFLACFFRQIVVNLRIFSTFLAQFTR